VELTSEQIAAIQAENETLKRTHAELIEKARTRKARIDELETEKADLQGKLTAANDTIRTVSIDAPLKKMSEQISAAPDLWLEQFRRVWSVSW
jgi:chromosome segregation ATPase